MTLSAHQTSLVFSLVSLEVHLPIQCLKRLSLTSRSLAEILLPRLYRTLKPIHTRDIEREGTLAQTLLSSSEEGGWHSRTYVRYVRARFLKHPLLYSAPLRPRPLHLSNRAREILLYVSYCSPD